MGWKMYGTIDGRYFSDVDRSSLVLLSWKEELKIYEHIIFDQATALSDLILTCRFLEIPHTGLL